MNSAKHIKRLSLIGVLEVGCVFLALFSLATFFDHLHWAIELLTHFKLQYFFIALTLGVIFLIVKIKIYTYISFCTVLINAVYLVPYYIKPNFEYPVAQGVEIKLLSFNVLSSNMQYSQLIQQVKQEDADIILLQEVNNIWLYKLEPLQDVYKFQIKTPRHDNFGMAILSKFPIDDYKVHKWGQFNIPSIEAILQIEQLKVSVFASHPMPPVSKQLAKERNLHLHKIASRVKELTGPKIVLGDLNITQWSGYFNQLQKNTGLRNVRKGFGVIPTWPTHLYPLMIPIDHCLVSEHFQVIDVKSGANFGSDHLPLIIELAL
ncbi:MAG: endonuclease/exonuclease/phosphatase family protein [Marinicellaceae bacterium]